VVERAQDPLDRLCALADAAGMVIVGATESKQHPDVDFTKRSGRCSRSRTQPRFSVFSLIETSNAYFNTLCIAMVVMVIISYLKLSNVLQFSFYHQYKNRGK
jgi:hypothetical protein